MSKDHFYEQLSKSSNDYAASTDQIIGLLIKSLQEHEGSLSQQETQISSLKESENKLREEFSAAEAQLEQKEATLSQQNTDLQESNRELAELREQLEQKEAILSQQNTDLQQSNDGLAELREQLEQKEATLRTIGSHLTQKISTVRSIIKSNALPDELKQDSSDLLNIYKNNEDKLEKGELTDDPIIQVSSYTKSSIELLHNAFINASCRSINANVLAKLDQFKTHDRQLLRDYLRNFHESHEFYKKAACNIINEYVNQTDLKTLKIAQETIMFINQLNKSALQPNHQSANSAFMNYLGDHSVKAKFAIGPENCDFNTAFKENQELQDVTKTFINNLRKLQSECDNYYSKLQEDITDDLKNEFSFYKNIKPEASFKDLIISAFEYRNTWKISKQNQFMMSKEKNEENEEKKENQVKVVDTKIEEYTCNFTEQSDDIAFKNNVVSLLKSEFVKAKWDEFYDKTAVFVGKALFHYGKLLDLQWPSFSKENLGYIHEDAIASSESL